MKLIDAHSHFSFKQIKSLYQLFDAEDIKIMFSITDEKKEHLDELLLLQKAFPEKVYLSIGLHPWQSDNVKLETLLPYIPNANFIGEIGLDNEWCNVDIAIQEAVFIQQLDLAAQLDKPIILHLKGLEKRAAEILASKQLKQPIFVHWFSGEDDALHLLNQLGCYFSIGPDVTTNPAQQRVLDIVEQQRLLTETDGPSAIKWVKNDNSDDDYLVIPSEIKRILQFMSYKLNQPVDSLTKIVNDNFLHLIRYSK